MNPEKFTQKTAEAIRSAVSHASENRNPSVEDAHLFYALLSDEGLIPEILAKLGADVSSVKRECEDIIAAFPKVTGGSEPYASRETEKILDRADKIRESMKDDYLSVEHLMISLIENSGGKLSEIFARHGIKKSAFLNALKEVRGNRRADSENPEGTYDVLKKYVHSRK